VSLSAVVIACLFWMDKPSLSTSAEIFSNTGKTGGFDHGTGGFRGYTKSFGKNARSGSVAF
jgi:hypothetical protein